DEEKQKLGAWETYSVQLNRVSPEDVANISWPERPE
ncbi:tail fiber assembly protein, partial [Enterobacter asburiae]